MQLINILLATYGISPLLVQITGAVSTYMQIRYELPYHPMSLTELKVPVMLGEPIFHVGLRILGKVCNIRL